MGHNYVYWKSSVSKWESIGDLGDLSEIEAFVGVVEAGGFRAAARGLGLTPSAVTKRVAALEERLGARLLNRTTRRVGATDVGQAFYERARQIVSDLREAESAVGELQGEPRGRIRLSSPVDFGRRYLTEPIADFARAYPAIELDVAFSDRFVDVVEEGFDVVLRIGQLPDSSLVSRRLAPCRRVLVASPAYLERHGRPDSADAFADHEFVLYALDRSRTIEVDGRPVAMRGRHRADDGALLCALARSGLGLALLPTFICGDDVRRGDLEIVLGDRVQADLALHAITPHRRLLSTRVRRLLDHLRERFGPRPAWDDGLDALGLARTRGA